MQDTFNSFSIEPNTKDYDYDPMANLFIAQSAKPSHVREINLRVLSPYQRALLVIDGTVTKFIEAYMMEPIEVIRLGQEIRQLPNEDTWLESPEGTDVIARQVLLRGKFSNRIYAYAVSIIVPYRLPEEITRGLDMNGAGIGRILLGNRMETRREVLWYGKERVDNLPKEMSHMQEHEFLSRTYRIYSDGKPMMLINERFPIDTESLPSHH